MDNILMPPGFIQDYCPKCERMTTHEILEDDDIFEHALECKVCLTVWEGVKQEE